MKACSTSWQTYDSLQDPMRSVMVDGVDIRTLDIDGLPNPAHPSETHGALT